MPTKATGENWKFGTVDIFSPRNQTTDLKSPVEEIAYTSRTRMRTPEIYCSELDLIFKQSPNNFKPIIFILV